MREWYNGSYPIIAEKHIGVNGKIEETVLVYGSAILPVP